MCFGTGKAERRASAQAAKDAAAGRAEQEKDRAAMMAEQQATREQIGRTSPPPSPYKLAKNKPGTGGVRTKKSKRSSSIGIAALRNPLNTGGPGGGINVG